MKFASDMPGRKWRAAGSSAAAVHFYRSDEPHGSHEHDAAHVSLVLAGTLQEWAGREASSGAAGALRIRPEGFCHSVSFGERGALILTLPAPPDDVVSWSAIAARGWLRLPRPQACRDILRGLFTDVSCDPSAASVELVAVASPVDAVKRPPKWLAAAHDRILEEPAHARVHALAAEAGVHRVHFARLFDAAYGAPPTVFRRRAMLDHAVAAILEQGEPLARAAASAGFADQAHMARAFAEFLGVTPGQLRASFT